MRVGCAKCKKEMVTSLEGKQQIIVLHLGKTYTFFETPSSIIEVDIEALETTLAIAPVTFEKHFEEICWEYVSTDAEGAQDVEK